MGCATRNYNPRALSSIDLVIIVGYLVAVVAAGAWFGRKQKTTTQYFLAGQHVPWWAISASIVATETSTITFISVPGIAYARGDKGWRKTTRPHSSRLGTT